MLKALIILCIIMIVINSILVFIDYSKGIQKEQLFICKYCGSKYKSWEFLIIHQKNNHFEEIEKESHTL